jgi:hypothetical protein
MENPIALIEAHQRRVDKMNGKDLEDVENAHALLKAVYRNPTLDLSIRMRAAIAALPFESPKLAVTAVVNEQDFATLLDQRLARMEAMKTDAIEARPEPVEMKPPLVDRRYRRL